MQHKGIVLSNKAFKARETCHRAGRPVESYQAIHDTIEERFLDHLYVQIVQSELRLLQGDVYVILLVCRVLQGAVL